MDAENMGLLLPFDVVFFVDAVLLLDWSTLASCAMSGVGSQLVTIVQA